MTLPDCLLDVEATVEESFCSQLDAQHAQVFQLCLCSSKRKYVHIVSAPSSIYFSVSDVGICKYKYQHYPTAMMGPCIHSYCINYGRSLMLLAINSSTYYYSPPSLSISHSHTRTYHHATRW